MINDQVDKIIKYAYKGFLIIMLIFGIMLSLSMASGIFNINKVYNQWIKTKATVMEIESLSGLALGVQSDSYNIVLKYNIDGKTITKKIKTHESPEIDSGEEFGILVHPEDPQNIVAHNMTFMPVLYIYLVLGLIISVVCAYLLFSKKESKRKKKRGSPKPPSGKSSAPPPPDQGTR